MDDPHNYEDSSESKFKRSLRKLFGGNREEDVTEEEIILMVDEGNEQGVLEDSEAEMIRNIFEFNDTNAKDIMTHRTNIVALSADMKLQDALHFVVNEIHSRYPVYSEDIDQLTGIVHIRDIMKAYMETEDKESSIKSIPNLLRPIIYVPETRSIDRLFSHMKKDKSHLAVVIDEYGQTAGIVTMEDILEEIVGNIQDEYDSEEEDIIPESEGIYVAAGLAQIDDIEDMIGISLDDSENDTINGYLISRLDRIPAENEKIKISDEHCDYEILSIKNNIIDRVRITVKDSKNQEED